ncbi:MAG: hypothetical protein K2J51_01660 [Alistipes sp.]|nr:hypothetical protein [Alistipes sp.]
MKKHSILFLAALAVASCSKDLPEEATPGFGNGATLTLRAMNDETRTVTEDGLRFEIVENEERIGVYIQSMGYTEENVLFTAGAKDEQTGWISFDQSEPSVLKLQNGTRVLAYAPYFPNTGTITGTGEAVETDATRAEWNGIRTLTLADIQTQSAPSSVGHLPDHYAMVATPTEATSEDGVNFHADLRFSGVFAVIRIVVANPADAAADATVSKVVFSAENAALTGSFRVNLTDENPSIANDEYRPEAVDGKSYGHVTVALDTPVTLKAGEQAELFAVVNAAAVTAPKAEVYATVDGRDVVFTKEFASSYDITRRKRTSFGVKLENPAEYDYAQEVADALVAGGTVVIEQDVDLTEKGTINIPAGVTVELRIPENITVTCGYNQIVNNGTMTLTGEGTLSDNGNDTQTAMYTGVITNRGTMTIENVDIVTTDVRRRIAILNDGGDITINNCNIDAAAFAFENKGTATINGGTFRSSSDNTKKDENNNPMYCYCVRTNGDGAKMTINDATIIGVQGALATTYGAYLEINGGRFTTYGAADGGGRNYHALYIAQNAEVTVNGGYFYSEGNVACVINGNEDIPGGAFGTAYLKGGYYEDLGHNNVTGTTLNPAEGYKWEKLAEPVTFTDESNGKTCTYNYRIVEKTPWAGEIAEPAYDEATKTYTVTEAAELAWVASKVNAGDDFAGKTVVLAADIDLNGTEWTPIGASATDGTNKYPFAGTFDGAGYTVSNLKVTRPDSSNAGLFGSSTKALKNVTINNASVTGKKLVGALVGQGYTGTIENCHVQGTVRIEGNYQVGGLSGSGYARITGCSVKGDAGSCVKGTFLEADLEGDAVGGIVGYSAEHEGDSYTTVPAISSCEVEIDVAGSRKVGGIAGQVGENSNIEGCSYKGSVATNAPESYIADNPGKIMVGGIYGELTGPIYRVYVKNSVVKSGTVVTGCDAKTTGLIRGGCSRSSSPVFTEEGNTVEANVTLNVPMPEGIEQVGATEYKVTGATGLANFAKMVNDGDDFAGKTVVLAADIDLSGAEWTPIANCSRKDASAGFKGVFDGNGKTISNINYSNSTDDYSAGLFGVINGGTVRNLTVEGGEIGSLDSAGAICGVMLGESVIENCHNKGVNVSADSAAGGIAGRAYGSNNTIRGCTNSGAVSGPAKVAGIVGIASAAGSTTTVSDCTNEGTISGKAAGGASGIVGYIGSYTEITGCHNNAAVGESGTVYAGGIVGYKQSADVCKISSCTNTAAVTGNTAGGIYGASGNNNQPVYLTGCTNSGTITGKTHAAGIAADMYAGSISECSNTGAVAAEQIAGGVAASMHTAEMHNCSGGTESVTATYAGRLIGEVATGTTTATLAIDDSNGDDYASLPTVGATSVGTSVSILTVTAGTLRGELTNQSASNSVIIIAEGAAWEQYPGETGRWLKGGNATSWTKQ